MALESTIDLNLSLISGVPFKEGVTVPERYTKVLRDINSFCDSIGIRYAVVGSLGVSLSEGIDFDPRYKTNELGQYKSRDFRDIDLIILDNQSKKELLKHYVSGTNYDVDVNFPYIGETIVFEDDRVGLKYKDIFVPTDTEIFTTYKIQTQDFDLYVPVLHPEVHRSFLSTAKLLWVDGYWAGKKIEKRIQSLDSLSTSRKVFFGELGKNKLKPFSTLQLLALLKYPKEVLTRKARNKYGDWVREGNKRTLVSAVRDVKSPLHS